MSAEPIDPVTASSLTPKPEYDVIHLGGQSAVVVPLADYLQLRALKESASIEALEDAEDMAALQESFAGTSPERRSTRRWTRCIGVLVWSALEDDRRAEDRPTPVECLSPRIA